MALQKRISSLPLPNGDGIDKSAPSNLLDSDESNTSYLIRDIDDACREVNYHAFKFSEISHYNNLLSLPSKKSHQEL